MAAERVVAIVQARMGSTRLPGQDARAVRADRPSSSTSSTASRPRIALDVWVATTTLAEDDAIAAAVRARGDRRLRGARGRRPRPVRRLHRARPAARARPAHLRRPAASCARCSSTSCSMPTTSSADPTTCRTTCPQLPGRARPRARPGRAPAGGRRRERRPVRARARDAFPLPAARALPPRRLICPFGNFSHVDVALDTPEDYERLQRLHAPPARRTTTTATSSTLAALEPELCGVSDVRPRRPLRSTPRARSGATRAGSPTAAPSSSTTGRTSSPRSPSSRRRHVPRARTRTASAARTASTGSSWTSRGSGRTRSAASPSTTTRGTTSRRCPSSRDGLEWHYHVPPASGIGDEWSDTWLSSNECNVVLARRLLERGAFPAAFRAGGTIEDEAASRWLEQTIPIDFSNRVVGALGARRGPLHFNWHGAPQLWGSYHPALGDLMRQGSLRRFVYRSIDLRSRYNELTEEHVDACFREVARDGRAARPLVLQPRQPRHATRDLSRRRAPAGRGRAHRVFRGAAARLSTRTAATTGSRRSRSSSSSSADADGFTSARATSPFQRDAVRRRGARGRPLRPPVPARRRALRLAARRRAGGVFAGSAPP